MNNLKYFFYYDADLPPGLGVPNFSPTHFAWLSVTLLLMVISIFAYRRLSEEERRKVMHAAAVAVVLFEASRDIWALAIGHFELNRMLPLHLCGVMVFFEFFAVFGHNRLAQEFVYATGLPGALMALITPEPSGYPLLSFQYLQSIGVHALLALIPLLWIFGDRFRPDIRYLPKCFGILLSLTVFDAVVNTFLHSNYLFICHAPAQTPIALFDAWVGHPWYVGLLLLCVLVVWTLMYLPWTLGKAGQKRESPFNLKRLPWVE